MEDVPNEQTRLEKSTWRLAQRIGHLPRFPLQQRLVRALAPPDSLRGVRVRLLTSDGAGFALEPQDHIDWHLTFLGSYEPEISALIRSLLQPGQVAADVGANVGVHTVTMSSAVGPRGRVIGVEPSRRNYVALMRNVELNGLQNVELHQLALSDAIGEIPFFEPIGPRNSGLGSTVRHSHLSRTPTPTPSTTLDQLLCNELTVALVKIDVEGGELSVLNGASAVLDRFSPQVVFEFDAELTRRSGASWSELCNSFPDGYRFDRVARRRLEPMGLRPPKHACNILATRPGRRFFPPPVSDN